MLTAPITHALLRGSVIGVVCPCGLEAALLSLGKTRALCSDGLTGIDVARICAKPPPNQPKGRHP